jgi:activating signal cointegrator 1
MNQEIRLLSLHEPWASLTHLTHNGEPIKKVETRHWHTDYRGLIAIHAAKRKVNANGHHLINELEERFGESIGYPNPQPHGIVCIARLVDCLRMSVDEEGEVYCDVHWAMEDGTKYRPSLQEEMCGDWEDGRYAWFLEDVRPCNPVIKCNGLQNLLPIKDPKILAQIEEVLNCGTIAIN